MNKPCAASTIKWIGTIERYSHMYLSRRLRRYGIGPGQLPFIMYLFDNPGISQDQFSKELYFDKGTTTRALQALEENGFIQRIPSDTDRRKNIVYLTEKAEELRTEIKRIMDEWIELLMKDMSREERSILMLMLQKTSANAIDLIEGSNEDQEYRELLTEP